ncbi:MAG TPA: hypothetical protein PLK90_04565 [Clostridiales bacterium]|nr:hypothetical protein [Clostridiales bacterium]HQP69654.1 hypothetical protein [Clostridiales bacterium]
MKRFLVILAILFSAVLYAQDTTAETTAGSLVAAADTVAAAHDVPELSEEEKLCKQAAEDFMAIYNSWDVTRDYEILLPRITAYAENYFNAGKDPNESNKEDLTVLKEHYESILGMETSETLMNILSADLERVNAELEGNQKNPALIGYLDKLDFDRIKVLEEILVRENNDQISSSVSALRPVFKNIRRYSIAFDEMLTSVYNEITRVTDKRVYFLYIEDNVKNKLQDISDRLAAEVDKKEAEFAKKITDDIDTLYAKKEAAALAGDRDLEKKLYNKWIEARKVNIDKLKSAEISRLTTVISGFMQSPGQYDVNSTLIHKLYTKSSDTEAYLKYLLRAKFYNDLNSKFKVYFRFEVEKGIRKYRLNILIASLFFFGLFFYVFTTVKKKRDSIYIRRIPGLDAIDDAVGRATEMGKPIIYDSGLGGFSSPQTIASMLILRSVAKKVAEFKAEIIYPAYDPVVLQIAEEMISSGFLDAGYPEDHKKDNCFFMVSDQFAYAAGLSGLIARKKPATALHFGYYAAESLLISEAGFAAGAIQVAGTTEATQLPFFITSCDYTLIGEELYAAAAYLSRDAQVLSNLKLSDYGKVIFGALFLLGTILLTINSDWTVISDLLSTY